MKKHDVAKKIVSRANAKQQHAESLPFLKNLADKEKDKNKDYIKRFGTFQDRLKKYEEWREQLNKNK